jgi:hypothetical protein
MASLSLPYGYSVLIDWPLLARFPRFPSLFPGCTVQTAQCDKAARHKWRWRRSGGSYATELAGQGLRVMRQVCNWTERQAKLPF